MIDLLENHNIHICPELQLPELQCFISDYWKNNHTLVVSKELMDWQHYDKENKQYNFIIAKHTRTNEINGILGFISNTHFDKSIQDCDLWLAIWKVRDDINVTGLGLSLFYYLVSLKNARSISAIGLSREVIPIYKYLGFHVGILNHYYIINKDMLDFNLIGNFDSQYHSNEIIIEEEKEFVRYDKAQLLELATKFRDLHPSTRIPTKSLTYLYNRYIVHPVYKYHIYTLVKHKNILGFLVFRLASHKSYCVLRMVDYIGSDDGLLGTFNEFQKLVSRYNAEYIDFYNLGLDEKLLASTGFVKRNPSCKIIIPNYFEPFEKKNVNLYFAYKCDSSIKFFLCKGDSDQDRPNFIPKNN